MRPLVPTLLALLAACGGGGSDPAANEPAPIEPAPLQPFTQVLENTARVDAFARPILLRTGAVVTGGIAFGGDAILPDRTVPESAAFVACYDADGTYAWGRTIAETDSAWPFRAFARRDGGLVVQLLLAETTTVFDEAVVVPVDHEAEVEFVLEADGTVASWRVLALGSVIVEAWADLDASGAMHYLVREWDGVTFDPGGPNESALATAPSGNFVYYRRTDAAGVSGLVHRVSTENRVYATAVTALADGSLVAALLYRGAPQFDGTTDLPPNADAALRTLLVCWNETQADPIWWRDLAGEVLVSDVAPYEDGFVIHASVRKESATFGLGEANERTIAATKRPDGVWNHPAVVARYSNDGRLLWARAATGPEYGVEPGTLAIAPNGGILAQTEGDMGAQIEGWPTPLPRRNAIARYESDGAVTAALDLDASQWTPAVAPDGAQVYTGWAQFSGEAPDGTDLGPLPGRALLLAAYESPPLGAP